MKNKEIIAYIGTYTNGESKGIYSFRMDALNGELTPFGIPASVENPSYLAISSDNKFLYSVAEVDTFGTQQCGAVASFSIQPETGALEHLNTAITNGKTPCHICLSSDNSYLFAANYKDGTVSSFSINSVGGINKLSDVKVHHGSGPNKERQEKPHAHFVNFTPDDRYLCAVDLGIDKIMAYDFHKENCKLNLNEAASVEIKSGSGPRHMVFHPNGTYAYIINELSSELTVLKYTGQSFDIIQYISALPWGYHGNSIAAAIHMTTDGKFLYTTNRGHDSIATFKIDNNTGLAELIGHTSTQGKHPRDFSIDPTGSFLFVANKDSSNIVGFAINKETGSLTPLGKTYEVPDPVCIKFCVF